MTTEAEFTRVRAVANASSAASNDRFNAAYVADQFPERDVPIDSLIPGFYLRQSGTDAAHVQLLADASGSTRLPPIFVQKNGLRIIDGMHRFQAAKLCLKTHISARVIDCTDEEAFILAIQSNTLHGLPLSKADRIAGAKRILASHPDWSDRAVAEVAGLSARAVGVFRNHSADEIPVLSKRLGRDGKRRPLSGSEGRRRAVDYIKAHPEAPLRQVAREADVSLGTVHDVRDRLRRGTDPLTERCRAAGQPADNRPAADTPRERPAAVGDPDARAARRHANGRNDTRQLMWSAISAKLAGDPAVRYTEGGRAFLRWMAMHAAHLEEWREFVDVIPAHWLKDIDLVASSISQEWRSFAESLKDKQEPAS